MAKSKKEHGVELFFRIREQLSGMLYNSYSGPMYSQLHTAEKNCLRRNKLRISSEIKAGVMYVVVHYKMVEITRQNKIDKILTTV